MKPSRLTAIVLISASTIALGGCSLSSGGSSKSPAANGPLSDGKIGKYAGTCAPASLGRIVTFGDEVFNNLSHTTLTLDRVTLLHPSNERLIGSYAVPGIRAIGVPGGPWPPHYSGMPSTWKDRQPVHGFRLAAGKYFNMVLGVTATEVRHARSSGMAVYYHDSSGSYVLDNPFAMIIAVNKRSC